jgi:hypothetical protein
MPEAADSSSTSFSLGDPNAPALANHAVARCAAAWDKVYRASMAKARNEYAAGRDAGKAFRQAMPPLCGYENICDFIACAGYGMLIGSIKEETGNRFLYAAQVALGAFSRSKTQSRSDA